MSASYKWFVLFWKTFNKSRKGQNSQMKIVFLNGGLANQVFQYIFFRCGQMRHPEEKWILDDSFFYVHEIHNGYELKKVFAVSDDNLLSSFFDADVWQYMIEQKRHGKSIPQIMKESGTEIAMFAEYDNYQQWNPFDGKVIRVDPERFLPEIMDMPMDIYYHGYWILNNWFRQHEEVFRKELSFGQISDAQNKKYEEMIADTESTSVHIRRGDYVTGGIAFEASSYHEMISKMIEVVPDMTLYVFSDEPEWCYEHAEEYGLKLPEKTVYITGNQNENAFRDLQLMSMCKNMLMSNSAFCYLAALLNQNIQHVINPTSRKL